MSGRCPVLGLRPLPRHEPVEAGGTGLPQYSANRVASGLSRSVEHEALGDRVGTFLSDVMFRHRPPSFGNAHAQYGGYLRSNYRKSLPVARHEHTTSIFGKMRFLMVLTRKIILCKVRKFRHSILPTRLNTSVIIEIPNRIDEMCAPEESGILLYSWAFSEVWEVVSPQWIFV